MKAYEALKRAIETAGEEYEEHRNESYSSTFYARKKQRLETVLTQVENRARADLLLRELRQQQLRFIEWSKEEAEHPTFYWYGEHYWEIVYDGEAAGCKAAIEALEAALDQADLESGEAKSTQQEEENGAEHQNGTRSE